MRRTKRIVKSALPLVLALIAGLAMAQPANISEAELPPDPVQRPLEARLEHAMNVTFAPDASPAEPVDVKALPVAPRATSKPSRPSATPRPRGTTSSPVDRSIQADPEAGTSLGTFSITCYSLTTNTSTGTAPDTSTAAVDPSLIPYGTRIRIEGIGEYVARDRGPRGRVIDIWKASADECRAFGRQKAGVSVIG